MNIFRTRAVPVLFAVLALLLAALWSGCEVDSTTAMPSDNDGTVYNFAGLYLNPENESSTNGIPLPIVYPNQGSSRPSGEILTSLRLLQYGSALEAFDSATQTWSGSINSLQGGSASFTLSGRTTAGVAVEIAGNMTYGDEKSTMNATWVEPNYYGTLYAQASVPPANTNSPDPDPDEVTLTASPTSVSLNESTTLTASGGDSSYAWPSSVSFGTISSSGSRATYTRTSGSATDSVTITVSSDGDSDSVNIAFD